MSNKCSHDDYDLNLPFTLERHLNNFREHDTNAQKLIDSFHIIRDNMKQNLKSVIMIFPHYSDHSHEHSENIISAIERLLGRERIEKLSPSDTWMLMVCAYMHDLGMLIRGKELEEDWKSEKFQDYIRSCKESFDDSFRKAANHVSAVGWVDSAETNWPVSVYKDVILLTSEFYRRKHPERSYNIPLQSDFGKYFNVVISGDGRLPPRIQDVIGKICFSHGIDFDEILTILEPVDSLFGYEFHPRFIAVMLCLGDLCDLDNGRFNKVSMEVFGEVTKNNYVHYYKHESVSSFVVKKDLIAVNFNIKSKMIKKELAETGLFKDRSEKEPQKDLQDVKDRSKKKQQKELQDVCDRVLLETQNWLGWIEELVKNIKLHWDELSMDHIETFSPSLTYKILVDGNETVSSKKNMRFSFSNEKAYELIESYSLYNNRFVFIRELLQNSVDALKRRFWTDIKSGRWNRLLQNAPKDKEGNIDYQNIQPFDFSDISVFDDYKVSVKIEHQPEDKTARFTIEDNGTGISKENLQERILRTGMRGRDKTVEEMPDWLRPTSSFGIGLHSVFGVSDSIFIRTRTSPDQPVYNINMHSSRDDGHVFMSLADDDDQNMKFRCSPIGTRMEFDIDVSKFDEYNIAFNLDIKQVKSKFCVGVENELEKDLGISLFDISYQFNEDKVRHTARIKSKDEDKVRHTARIKSKDEKENEDEDKDKKENYKLIRLFFSTERNKIFDNAPGFEEDNPKYDFILGPNAKQFVLWDRARAILMVYGINDIGDRNGGILLDGAQVCCKGFEVGNNKVLNNSNILIPRYIDYWGGNTKDILNVSRDSLSHKQLEQNESIFKEAAKFIAKIYHDVLKYLLKSDGLKEWHERVGKFVTPWLLDENPTKPDMQSMLDEFVKMDIVSGFDNKDIIKNLLLHWAFCKLVKAYMEKGEKNVLENLYRFYFENNKINSSKKEPIFDFVDDSLRWFVDSYGHLYNLKGKYNEILRHEPYNEILRHELHDEILRHKLHDEILRHKLHDAWGNFGMVSSLQYSYDYIEYCKPDTVNFLDLYFHVPLIKIIYLMLWAGVDISPLQENIRTELSYLPGYNNGYGFENKKDVGDIIFSSELKTSYSNYRRIGNYLFFLEGRKINKIAIENDESQLVFGKEYNERNAVVYEGENAFAVFLNNNNNYYYYYVYDVDGNEHKVYDQRVPVPSGFEDIAVKSMSNSDIFAYAGTYMTYLWDDFDKIKEAYAERIKNGEDIKKLADEIMPVLKTDKKPATNVLRNICYDRVFNTKLSYDEAWKNVCDTYRKFVIKVLNAVKWLSDHEAEPKKEETTDDNNEEAE